MQPDVPAAASKNVKSRVYEVQLYRNLHPDPVTPSFSDATFAPPATPGGPSRKEISMSLQARLESLSERHQALEAALEEERRHAAMNEQKISDLKRRKLALKDEMTSLHSKIELPSERRPS
jgi:hypothetical protein